MCERWEILKCIIYWKAKSTVPNPNPFKSGQAHSKLTERDWKGIAKMKEGYVTTGGVLIIISIGLLASLPHFLEPANYIWSVISILLLSAGSILIVLAFITDSEPKTIYEESVSDRMIRIGQERFHDMLHNEDGVFYADLNDYRWLFLYIDTREGYEVVFDHSGHVDLLNAVGHPSFDLKMKRIKNVDWKRVDEVGFIFCNWDGVVHNDNKASVLVDVCKKGIRLTVHTDPRTGREDWAVVLNVGDARKPRNLLEAARTTDSVMKMDNKVFVGYVGSPDIHDGEIIHFEHKGDKATVVVKGGWLGNRITLEFVGVESVESEDPIGMILYSLNEAKAPPPMRMFAFVNWYEHDEPEGKAYLRILARDFEVLEEPM